MKKLAFIFSIVMVLFSCKKDDTVKPIDPTEEVVLTVKMSFQYFSSDVSLKKVQAFLRMSEESSIIVSANADLSGRPATYDLVLKLSGQAAKNIIDKEVHISAKVIYMVGGEEIILEADIFRIIWGGEQSVSFDYEIVPVKKIEVVVHNNFAYGNNVVLLVLYGIVRDSHGNGLQSFLYEKIEDTPDKITSVLILEGAQALENIGKNLVIQIRAEFRFSGASFNTYWQEEHFVAQEGVQEFEFLFCHPLWACDE